MKGYSFTELAKLVEAAMPRAGGAFSGNVSAPRFIGPLQGNADTATAAGRADKLSTARNITIGSTPKAFDGTGNLSWSLAEIGAINESATVAAAHKWATPRGLQIGNSSKAVDGTTNVAWSLTEIGAVNKNGDTMTGSLNFSDSGTTKRGIQGVSGGTDFWFVGGGATASDAGYMEISTGDDGTEPIYVRQYNGDFVSVARTLTLLDESGNTVVPRNISAVNGGVTVANTECGIYPGNGDGCTSTVNNLKLTSWYGIGFGPSITGQPVPNGEYSHWFNTRNGDMDVRGTITAPRFAGNADTATAAGRADRLATGRSIALAGDVSGSATFDGSANITITTVVADDSHAHVIGNIDGLQEALDGKKAVAVLSGWIANGGTIPLPSGFTEAQCKWIVSTNDLNTNNSGWDIREGLATNHLDFRCYTTGRVVTATVSVYNDTDDKVKTYASTANYIIIGVK